MITMIGKKSIEMESLLFAFIKSLRDADFYLFVQCFEEIVPSMFALHHVHYTRWMPVFIEDLHKLPLGYP